MRKSSTKPERWLSVFTRYTVHSIAAATMKLVGTFYQSSFKMLWTLQKIVVYDWLPALLGEGLEPYDESKCVLSC